MRAMQVTELGQPLSLQDIPKPEPAAGQVLVKVHTCGLNFGDLLIIKGTYQERPAVPFTLGMELCGTVEAVGDDVTSIQPGQRVAAYCGFDALADYAAIPADVCIPVPDQMTDEHAAAFLIAYGTSHVALDYKAHLKPSERLLVLGASGKPNSGLSTASGKFQSLTNSSDSLFKPTTGASGFNDGTWS